MENTNNTQNIDVIIGHIEDIIMDEKFQGIQKNFFEENCDIFTNEEENKFEYTVVFGKYVEIIETYISKELMKVVGNVDLCQVAKDLK